ncbi:MAG: hypothetical protein ACLU9Q_07810 [Marvinbryantia sp.]
MIEPYNLLHVKQNHLGFFRRKYRGKRGEYQITAGDRADKIMLAYIV